jgi:hypothetical protein
MGFKQSRILYMVAALGIIGAISVFAVRHAIHHRQTEIPTSFAGPSSPETDRELTMSEWRIFGPFAMASKSSPSTQMSRDYLPTIGLTERALNQNNLPIACLKRRRCLIATQGQLAITNLDKLFPHSSNVVAYAVAVLDSPFDGYIGLQYDASSGAQVWLNDRLVDSQISASRHPVFMYANCVPLHVHTGTNVLVIKTAQYDPGPAFEPWAIVASIMPLSRMRDILLRTRDGFLLSRRFLESGEPIDLPILHDPMKLDWTSSPVVNITDWHDHPIMNTLLSISDGYSVKVPALPPGYYRISLSSAGNVINDSFYVGDPSEVYRRLQTFQERFPKQAEAYQQIAPLLTRYEILTSAKYSNPSDGNWQKKLLMVLDPLVQQTGTTPAPV